MKPGPRVPGKLAKSGEYCPPGSEGSTVYRGIRPFRKVCKYGGHPKPHPGRCVECRRLSDKARDMSAERAAKKRATYLAWSRKPANKAKIAEKHRKYASRAEVKAMNARRQRMYRRGEKMDNPGKPSEVAARLLAKAEAKASQARYGITQAGNYNP